MSVLTDRLGRYREDPIAIWGLGLSLAIGVLHAQQPLLSSNQHTYFLHALAPFASGLSHDWLVNTVDAQPVFTLFLHGSYWLFGPNAVFAWMGCITALYAACLWSIARSTFRVRTDFGFVLGFAVVVAFHAGVDGDWHRRLFQGLAKQYLIVDLFQPSVAGVFLLGAVAASLERRMAWTIVGLVLAPVIHPTYLMHAGILSCAIAVEWAASGQGLRPILLIPGWTALALAPIAIYLHVALYVEDGGMAARAACILAKHRIPQHTDIARWFDAEAKVAVTITLVAVLALIKRPIGKVLAMVFAVSTLLVLAQYLTGSCRLALLFPQRSSVIVLPIVSTLALTYAGIRLVRAAQGSFQAAPVVCVGAIILLSCVQGILGWRALHDREPAPVLRAIRAHLSPRDTLLLLPPRLREDVRLGSGRSIVVDYKTHPFAPAEVLEWWSRYDFAKRITRKTTLKQLLEAQRLYGATHVLQSTTQRALQGLPLLYEDAQSRLYELPRPMAHGVRP